MSTGVIAQLGTINVASLNVPQVVVQIVPPQYLFGGVQTNIGGIVGTASWGPVNSPQAFGNVAQEALVYGPTINRLYDIGGHAILAFAQGASFLYGVRVTDGTDVASSVAINSTAAIAATATFTESTTKNFLATDTVTIGNQTFTFVASIGSTPGNILVGADTNAGFVTTMNNIIASMAASISGGAATANYVPNTTPSNVSGAAGNGLTTGATYIFTALTAGTAGNSLTSTYTDTGGTSAGSFGASTFAGGAAAIVGATITAKYTGTLGNNMKATTSVGTKSGSYKIILSMAGYSPEVYDNITGVGNAMWIALANAINNGSSSVRGPSQLAVATAGVGTAMPASTQTTWAFAGGTDGAASITTSVLVGTDTLPRTGMYALRQTNCSKAMLADLSDATSFSTQLAFGLSIGCEMIVCTAAGDTISNAVTELAVAGIDNFSMTCMFGDWIYWLDTYNGIPMRLSSPQSVKLGMLCNLSPQNSPLNKEIYGIIGTQKSLTGIPYTSSDLELLGTALMDVVGNPSNGGNYFSCLFGKNCSSNEVTQGDEYTQMIYFIAKSLLVIGGQYIGATLTPSEMLAAKTSVTQFLSLIALPASQGGPEMIGTVNGTQPYNVVLDATNNTQDTAALGFQFAYVQVTFWGIVRYFIFSLQGGASVIISENAPNANVAAAP